MRHYDQPEFDGLLDALCEGHLDADGVRRLEGIVKSNPKTRRRYLDYIFLETALRRDNIVGFSWKLSEQIRHQFDMENREPAQNIDLEGAKHSPILGFLGDVMQQGTNWFSQNIMLACSLMLFALTATIIVGVWLFAGIQSNSSDGASLYVAHISETHECVWGANSINLISGMGLITDQHLSLQSGFVELAFRDGAKVILEGPAEFTLQNSNKGYLDRGKLVANVPKSAIGFTICTTHANVIDLGTQFGLEAFVDKAIEVHVFDGRVQLELLGPKGTLLDKNTLVKGQAVRVGPMPSQITTLVNDPSDFCQTLSAERLLNRNLIDNGDFESCTYGERLHNGYLVDVNIPGWDDRAPATMFPYKSNGTYRGLRQNTPGPTDRGRYYFVGVTDCEISQQVDLDELASRIDKSRIRFDLSGWLGGRGKEIDSVVIDVYFLDEEGRKMGESGLGPVTATHRQATTGLFYRQEQGPVPIGTRSVRIKLKSIHGALGVPAEQNNPTSDGYADNLRLILKEVGK